MHIFHFTIVLSMFIYAVFFQYDYLKIYLSIIVVYFVGYLLTPKTKYYSLRRKLMIPCWKEQEEGNVLARFELDTTNLKKLAEKYPHENKISITHLVIKMVAEILKQSPEANGKISFGKFVPYDNVTVSCLVDIDGGKDLANVTIKDADKKSIEEIAELIKNRATSIKNKKDQTHQKMVSPFRYVPSFLIRVAIEITYFLGSHLGLKAFSTYMFGPAVVTSVGMLNVVDCFAPNNLVSKAVFLVSIGQIQDRPVAINKKVEIRPMVFVNFVGDHRFIDGGRCKKINDIIYDSFEHPEKYCKEPKL